MVCAEAGPACTWPSRLVGVAGPWVATRYHWGMQGGSTLDTVSRDLIQWHCPYCKKKWQAPKPEPYINGPECPFCHKDFGVRADEPDDKPA